MNKAFLFVKKYGLWIFLILLIFISTLVLPTLFFSKKPINGIDKVMDKTRKEIDKIDAEIEIKKVEVVVKTQAADSKKEEILNHLNDIKLVKDPEERRRRTIDLHEKIKKFK